MRSIAVTIEKSGTRRAIYMITANNTPAESCFRYIVTYLNRSLIGLPSIFPRTSSKDPSAFGVR